MEFSYFAMGYHENFGTCIIGKLLEHARGSYEFRGICEIWELCQKFLQHEFPKTIDMSRGDINIFFDDFCCLTLPKNIVRGTFCCFAKFIPPQESR